MGRFVFARPRQMEKATANLFEDYFVGLNYLLNDEPDEAIDTFINALEINSDTIETHLALGALLRRRGKVDKAIKVHQALLARPALEANISAAARLQLALNYIAAGLLDRAERLLNELLTEGKDSQWESLQHLITIYQTEKEWEKAIASANKLMTNPAFKKNPELCCAAAQYCCELAELLLEKNDDSKARAQIKRAFSFEKRNLRASLLLAKIEQRTGNFKASVKQLVKIWNSNPEFIGELLQPLAECYEQLNAKSDFEKLLRGSLSAHPSVKVVLTLFGIIKESGGDQAALSFLQESLQQNPTLPGMLELLSLQIDSSDHDVESSLNTLRKLIEESLLGNSEYQCTHCGYESKNLYWMCPSCKKWDKISPIHKSLSK